MSSNEPHVSVLRRGSIGARVSFGTALLAAAALLTCSMAAAQSTQANGAPTESTARKSSHARSKPSPAHAPVPQEQTEAAQAAPEPPHWPANDSPATPTVTWDSQGLKIDASNASLHQILNDVSTATGAKVEGFGADERVFGEYGPGKAGDILSQLLHGSGYNVLMIGDQGEGTPRQIVLSPRKTGTSAPTNHPSQDAQEEDVPEPPEPEEQPPPQPQLINGRPPMPPQGPQGPPRTPQQILQELQQRQQQIQDQQQQQPH